jgi:hypothetical protein
MFFEKIKQISSTFREEVNLFLSRIFNKEVPIAEDMTTLILIGFAIFIIILGAETPQDLLGTGRKSLFHEYADLLEAI